MLLNKGTKPKYQRHRVHKWKARCTLWYCEGIAIDHDQFDNKMLHVRNITDNFFMLYSPPLHTVQVTVSRRKLTGL
jgi:hypothetical protein